MLLPSNEGGICGSKRHDFEALGSVIVVIIIIIFNVYFRLPKGMRRATAADVKYYI